MKFLLVDGYIKFPKYITKEGTGLLEKPENEVVCQRLEITAVQPPGQAVLDQVEGKYFERYSEAEAYLGSLEE